MTRAVIVAAILIVAAPSASWANCLASSYPRGESRSTITLIAEIKQPYFYFRSMDYNYALLVNPEEFLAALRSRTFGMVAPDTELLSMITRDMPLTRDTDLFQFILKDSYQFSLIQSVLSVLLEHGKAAIFEAGTGQLLKDITLKRDNSTKGSARTFYAGKTLVFFQSDCIVN